VSSFLHLKKETDPGSETLAFSYLEFRTMDKAHKHRDSKISKSIILWDITPSSLLTIN
jgi:hypothetical protein